MKEIPFRPRILMKLKDTTLHWSKQVMMELYPILPLTIENHKQVLKSLKNFESSSQPQADPQQIKSLMIYPQISLEKFFLLQRCKLFLFKMSRKRLNSLK